jgi:hypothetical protein
MTRILVAVSLGMLCPLLSSQVKVQVSPPDHTNIYTGNHNGIPLGGYQSVEQLYQQVDEGLVGTQRVISGMAFAHTWSSDYGARTYTMEVKIGDAATKAATISDTFTSNFAGTPQVVHSGKLSWPVRSRGFTLPGPFDSAIPFSGVYIYSGQNPICWQMYVSADSGYTTGTADHFFMAGTSGASTFPKYWAGAIGTGCLPPGASPLRGDRPLLSQGFVHSGTKMYSEWLIFGPRSVPVTLKLGLPADKFAGLQLPLSLSLIGSPAACNLFVSPLVDVLNTTTDNTGRAEVNVPFAFGASTTGLQFRTQWFAFNTGRSMITSVSNGLSHLVPYDHTNKQFPIARNWGTTFGTTLPVKSTGRGNGNNNQRNGNNEPYYGLITEYWYR